MSFLETLTVGSKVNFISAGSREVLAKYKVRENYKVWYRGIKRPLEYLPNGDCKTNGAYSLMSYDDGLLEIGREHI